MNERQLYILRIMLAAEENITANELASRCECSAKTVLRDLQFIEELNKDLSLVFRRIPGKGIRLECDSAARSILTEIANGKMKLCCSDSVENRRNQIYLDLLLHSPAFDSVRNLSEEYLVGSSSIVNDLMEIEKRCQRCGLVLQRTRKGTFITGDERIIRDEVAKIQYRLNSIEAYGEENLSHRLNSETKRILEGLYGAENVLLVEQCIDRIEEELQLFLGVTYYVNVITHILIAVERIKSERYINDSCTDDGLEQTYLYEIIEKHIRELFSTLSVPLSKEESWYIYSYFMSSGVEVLPNQIAVKRFLQENDQNALSFCNELVAGVEEKLQVSFGDELYHEDSDIFCGLLLHVNSMISRLKYGVKITNALKDDLIVEYPKMFSAVKETVSELEEKYFSCQALSEDEVLYLCLYLQLALKKNNPARVLLVCSTGIGTSHMLRKRVEQVFPELQIVDVISLRQLMKYDLEHIDLIITTIRINIPLKVPDVVVSVLLNEKDINAIRCML